MKPCSAWQRKWIEQEANIQSMKPCSVWQRRWIEQEANIMKPRSVWQRRWIKQETREKFLYSEQEAIHYIRRNRGSLLQIAISLFKNKKHYNNMWSDCSKYNIFNENFTSHELLELPCGNPSVTDENSFLLPYNINHLIFLCEKKLENVILTDTKELENALEEEICKLIKSVNTSVEKNSLIKYTKIIKMYFVFNTVLFIFNDTGNIEPVFPSPLINSIDNFRFYLLLVASKWSSDTYREHLRIYRKYIMNPLTDPASEIMNFFNSWYSNTERLKECRNKDAERARLRRLRLTPEARREADRLRTLRMTPKAKSKAAERARRYRQRMSPEARAEYRKKSVERSRLCRQRKKIMKLTETKLTETVR